MSNSTITTGTVNTAGSTTYISGTSSGINTGALIDAAVSQRTAAADRLDLRIENNEARSGGYDELKSLADAVKSSLNNLRQTYGFSSTSTSAFNRKAGTLITTQGSGTPGNLVGVTLADSAAVGSYDITVQQRAVAHKVASGSVADRNADLGQTGTFSIGLDGATAASINVTADMSLQEIASAINAQRATTKVSATVLKVSENDYQLVLTGTATAKDIQITDTSGGVMQSIGVIDGGGAFLDEIDEAKQAILEVDGITITRDSNTITDLIDGVTLTLKGEDVGTTINLEITNDSSAVADTISAFVDAYNAFRDFVVRNQSVGEGGAVAEDAVLHGDTIMNTLNLSLQGLFATNVNSTGSINTLRDIGISLTDDNHLQIDAEALSDALANDYQGVRDLFESRYTSGDSNFTLLNNTSSNVFGPLNFSVTHDGTNITDVTVNGQSGMFDIAGGSIVGKAGTAYEGLRFAYIGTTSSTFTFNLTQGIGDLLSNSINKYTDAVNGMITEEQSRILDTNETLSQQATRIRERAEDYRASLINRYAQMEALVNQANTTLNQIRAILGTNDD
jgi:flagellar hook-associated protein 2